MNPDSDLKPESQLDPEYYEALYKELDKNLFNFKNDIQLGVIKQLNESEDIKSSVIGEAEKGQWTTSDFDAYISNIAIEQSPVLRGKIYEFLLSEVAKSNDPAELLYLNKENIDEFIGGDIKQELVNNLTDYIKNEIIEKHEKGLAA